MRNPSCRHICPFLGVSEVPDSLAELSYHQGRFLQTAGSMDGLTNRGAEPAFKRTQDRSAYQLRPGQPSSRIPFDAAVLLAAGHHVRSRAEGDTATAPKEAVR